MTGSVEPKRIVEIANKTQFILKPVGVYNKSLEWPLGDVGSLRLVAERFNSDTFSFASNYRVDCGIGKEKINLHFSTSLDTQGNKKINVGVINQNGNQPAKSTWDKMTDPVLPNLHCRKFLKFPLCPAML